jgi:hypothetical protein
MNITYLFGAGASIGALPIVNQIPERIESTVSLMSTEYYRLSDEEFYAASALLWNLAQ